LITACVHGPRGSDRGHREDLRGRQGSNEGALLKEGRLPGRGHLTLARFRHVEVPLCSGHFRFGSGADGSLRIDSDRDDVSSDDKRSHGRVRRAVCRLLPAHRRDDGETCKGLRRRKGVRRRTGTDAIFDSLAVVDYNQT
jgi:hypothetical protein